MIKVFELFNNDGNHFSFRYKCEGRNAHSSVRCERGSFSFQLTDIEVVSFDADLLTSNYNRME